MPLKEYLNNYNLKSVFIITYYYFYFKNNILKNKIKQKMN